MTTPPIEPPAEKDPKANGVAAYAAPTEVVPTEADTVESAAESTTPAESATPKRPPARTPGWAWVAITLMSVLLITGAITWAVVRNANPSTPAAVKDMETLTAELTTLNGYLATTNSLMSNAIANSQQLSAKAQAQLASLSTQVDGLDASLGQARSLLGDQLSSSMRSKLAKSQNELQSREAKLAAQTVRLQQQQFSSIRGDVGAIGNKVGVATASGTQRASAIEAQVTLLQVQLNGLETQVQEAMQLRAAEQAERLRADRLEARVRALQQVVARLQKLVDRLQARR